MPSPRIKTYFVCKDCKEHFQKVTEFMKHKRQQHLEEYKSINCIVFEESDKYQPSTLEAVQSIIEQVPQDDQADEISEAQFNDSEEIVDGGGGSPGPDPYSDNNSDEDDDEDDFSMQQEPSNTNTSMETSTPTKSKPKPRRKKMSIQNITPIQPPDAESEVVVQSEQECNLCSKKLYTVQDLKNHLMICAYYHKDLRSRFCIRCNQLFDNSDDLQVHTDEYHEPPPEIDQPGRQRSRIRCQHCSKIFMTYGDLKAHITGSHKGQQKPYMCQVCGLSFPKQNNLTKHTIVHSDDRPYKCTEPGCDKAFKWGRNLRLHLPTHSADSSK